MKKLHCFGDMNFVSKKSRKKNYEKKNKKKIMKKITKKNHRNIPAKSPKISPSKSENCKIKSENKIWTKKSYPQI